MLICPQSCITTFIDQLDASLRRIHPNAKLSLCQRAWLITVLAGILVTGVLCWAVFERRSVAGLKQSQLRWMFYHAKLAWSRLLQASVRCILKHYGITAGTLVIDDTDKRRTKVPTKIADAHKVKDKKSGGYFNGQELVFLLLVTETLTFPVDFRFYAPDPALSAWRKLRKQQNAQGIPAAERQRRPTTNPQYRSKIELAADMVAAFRQAFPDLHIRGILADALYGNNAFMDAAATAVPGSQVISELRTNQLVISGGKAVSLKDYFTRQSGVPTLLIVRGQSQRPVEMLSARLHIKAHGKKRFVVALRYAGEKEYRYLVASDMSWRAIDIARMHSLRWLIEVFIEDWKAHGGWNRLTKHQGKEGSTRGVILSLLCDHLLLLHPEQSARFKNKQPGLSAGCLIERLKMDALINVIAKLVHADDPVCALEAMTQSLLDALPQRESKKHMVGLDLGRQEPTPSLRYHQTIGASYPLAGSL